LLPPLAPSADRSAPAGAPSSARTESADRLDVDLIERKREYPPTYPPPPPAAKATERPQRAEPSPPPPPAPRPEPQAAPVLAEPFPSAPPREDAGAFAPPPEAGAIAGERRGDQAQRLRQSPAELNRAAAERRTQARQLDQLRAAREEAAEAARAETSARQPSAASLGYSRVEREEAPSMADTTAELQESAEGGDYAEDRDARSNAVDAFAPAPPASAAPGQGLPPVSADLMLAPADWIARIRERWRAGDHDGALDSLRRLRERHPDVAIPADLQALR
jgi:hypothetical protein